MDYTAVQRIWRSSITQMDPWLADLLEREEQRQFRQICLAAASSLCPPSVREAQACVFSNIDAEGYPPKRMAQVGLEHLLDLEEQVAYYQRYGDLRYNKGSELANVVEVVAQRRAAAVFSTEWANHSDISVNASDIHVNLQCPTGSLANTAVFEALLKPGDVVLSMNLVDGGHLTHGSPLHRSGKTYKIVHYGVDPSTQRLDYDQIRDLVHQYRPKLIVGGASSYPWAFDWKRFRQIAEEIEPRPYILADISHPAGLVAAGLIPNPVGYADVATFTTYKTLCGPRGAAILSTDHTIAESIDRAVFPGLQSAPVFQQIVALAVAFEIARTQEFKLLQHKIAENARLLHQHLTQQHIPTAFGGTDTHMVVADVGKIPTSTKQRLTGDVVSRILEKVGISCNSNLIPGDKQAPLASGIRLGTTWISQSGYGEPEIREIAAIIAEVCRGIKTFRFYGPRRETLGGKVDEELLQSTSQRVREVLKKSSEHIPNTPPEKKHDGSNYAKAQPRLLATGGVEIWDLRSWSEALIVRGERSTSFLQSVITGDIYDLKQGEFFSTLVLNTNGEKRLDVLVCCLSSDPHPRFLLVYQGNPATNFDNWLHMLSDGYVEVERDDPHMRLDGPVIIKGADFWRSDHTGMGEILIIGDEADNILKSTLSIGNTKPLRVVEIPFRGQTLFGIRTVTDHSTAAWKVIGTQQLLSELLEILSSTHGLRIANDTQTGEALFEVKPEIDDTILALFGSGTGIEPEGESLIAGSKPYFIGQSALPKIAHLNEKKRFSFEEIHSSGNSSRLSPLYCCHKALGVGFTDFAGYQMPLYYTSSSQEHQHVRKHAGLFDLSYKVLLGFRGHGAERFLDLVLTEHIPQLETGGSCRACILSPEGMIISDCILYRLEADYFVMELDPVNAQMVESWLRAVAARDVIIDLAKPGAEVDSSCSITNLRTCSDPLVILALQGPKSTAIIQSLLNDNKSRYILNKLRKGQITGLSLTGIAAWIARRGYTGEPVGYEIFVPQAKAEFLWNALMDVGLDYSLSAIGLSAADSLRIEAGLPLYGKDLAGPYHISPIEAGFGSGIKLDKPFFIGRQHMLSCSPCRRMVRLRAEIDATDLGKLEPTIHNDAGKIIGVITSTAYLSGQYYGLGLLDENPFDTGKIYFSYKGSPSLLAEVISIPYATVIET
jgi:glycine/serine hydroxymethyltransferase/glycine cleavage system aminomethyltransferase T